MCSQCVPGYYRSLDHCLKCNSSSSFLKIFLFFFILVILFLLLLISRNFLFMLLMAIIRVYILTYFAMNISWSVELSFLFFLILNSSEQKGKEYAGTVKVLIFYSQMISLYSLGNNYGIFSVSVDLINIFVSPFNIYCLIPSLSNTNSFKFYGIIFIPFFLIFLLVFFVFLQHKISPKLQKLCSFSKSKSTNKYPNFIFVMDEDEYIAQNDDLESEEIGDREDVLQYVKNKWRIVSMKIFLIILFISYFQISKLIFGIINCTTPTQQTNGISLPTYVSTMPWYFFYYFFYF